MLKELLSHRPIQVALLLVIFIGISGVLYLNHVKTETEGDVVNTETGVLKREPPNPSAQDGHRHADGTWHAEPHESVEVSEAEDSDPATPAADLTRVQGESDFEKLKQGFAQVVVPPQKNKDVERAWIEWHEWQKKIDELKTQLSQLNHEMIDALPTTEEELKRFETDAEFKREVQRKYGEVLNKSAKIDAMLDALMEKQPTRPTQ